ncbi:MAG: ribosomal L7Ae/L30e/S12e/Gadd45 family protein [Candidatus Izemoplasma sp.]|nr:ribosomal L7Ae/L30e/S12e/Gadd45 family protein [Candidatus Izemoplasma sp.]
MDKVLSLLGLAKRAGKLVIGEKNVLDALKELQQPVIFLGQDAGSNIKDKVNKKAHHYKLVLCTKYSKKELSQAVGTQNHAMMMVLDKGFNDAIKKEL